MYSETQSYLRTPRPGASKLPLPTTGSRASTSTSTSSMGSTATSLIIGLNTRGSGGSNKEVFKEKSFRIDYALHTSSDQTTAAYRYAQPVPPVSILPGGKTIEPGKLPNDEPGITADGPGGIPAAQAGNTAGFWGPVV